MEGCGRPEVVCAVKGHAIYQYTEMTIISMQMLGSWDWLCWEEMRLLWFRESCCVRYYSTWYYYYDVFIRTTYARMYMPKYGLLQLLLLLLLLLSTTTTKYSYYYFYYI